MSLHRTLYRSIPLLLLWLSAVANAVSYQRISPSNVVVSARLYELRVDKTSVSMHTRRKSTGLIRENDYLQYVFEAWRDNIYWSESPNNGTNECTETLTPIQNFTSPYQVDVADGPGGTTLVSSLVYFGAGCNLSTIFYVTDVDTWILIDGFNNSVAANEAKISFRLYCPWRSQLQQYENVPLSTPVWGRGRRFTVFSYFNVITSAQFNDYPRANFTDAPRGWPNFPGAADGACRQTPMDPEVFEYPTPSIFPNYDFAREATLTFSTTESITTVGFLTWAIADGNRRVRAGTDVGNRTLLLNGLGYIYWPVDIRTQYPFHSASGPGTHCESDTDFEGYNSVFYDPSLTQIFFEDDDYIDAGNNAPGLSRGGAPGTDLSQDGVGLPGGAVAGIIVAVAVLAIASAAVWYFIRRSGEQRERSRVASALGRDATTTTIANSTSDKSNQWAKASTNVAIKNTK